MKYTYSLIALLLLAGQAFGAGFTAAASGNWNASATWGKAGDPAVEGTDYPGFGDTATVPTGKLVTVPSGFEAHVGTDPATTYSNAVVIQGTGGVRVLGTLYCRGGISVQRGTCADGKGNIYIGPDATLYLDNQNTAFHYIYPNSTGNDSATLQLDGTEGHPAVLDGDGGRSGYFGLINGADSTTFDIISNYGIFRNLGGGGGTSGAITHYIGDGQQNTLTNTLFDGCYFTSGAIRLSHGNANLSWNGVDVRNSQSALTCLVNQSADKTTGTRSITNLTAYHATASSIRLVASGLSIDGFYSYNTTLSTAATSLYTATGLTVTNWMVVSDTDSQPATGAPLANGGQTWSEGVVLLHDGADGNGHGPWEVYDASIATGANTYSGLLFDGDGINGSGDNVICRGEAVITGTLGINRHGVLVNAFVSTAAVTVRHNTVQGDGESSLGTTLLGIGESSGDATMVVDVRSNLLVKSYRGIYADAFYAAQTGWDHLDYNCSYLNLDSNCVDYPVGHPYAGENGYLQSTVTFNPSQTFGSDNATHDIYVDPGFVDNTWTVRGFFGADDTQTVGREIVTVNGRDYQGTDTTATTKTVAGVLAAARAAYAPTNSALKDAGHDGVTIGAVEFGDLLKAHHGMMAM